MSSLFICILIFSRLQRKNIEFLNLDLNPGSIRRVPVMPGPGFLRARDAVPDPGLRRAAAPLFMAGASGR
jgi:hypothetical protein